MNFSHPIANPRKLVAASLIVALLVVLAFAVVAPAASAGGGSGGVGFTGESADERTKNGAEGKQSARQKARYRRLWNRVGRRDRRWARRTSRCESGRDPKAIGGGGRYRGAFQFMRSTWRAAPKSPGGDPIAYNYKTQAVVAVALKRQDGRHHWPHCG